jgi:hypothetical protein
MLLEYVHGRLRSVCVIKVQRYIQLKFHIPSNQLFDWSHHSHCNLMSFGAMGTRLTGLREKDGGPTVSQPARSRDLGQEAHSPRHLRDILQINLVK